MIFSCENSHSLWIPVCMIYYFPQTNQIHEFSYQHILSISSSVILSHLFQLITTLGSHYQSKITFHNVCERLSSYSLGNCHYLKWVCFLVKLWPLTSFVPTIIRMMSKHLQSWRTNISNINPFMCTFTSYEPTHSSMLMMPGSERMHKSDNNLKQDWWPVTSLCWHGTSCDIFKNIPWNHMIFQIFLFVVL